MSRLGEKLKQEVREMVPAALFFFAGFQLLALTEALMLERYGIRVRSFLAATLAALIVAKVVLIADHIRFVDRFPSKPLFYNVAWKTSVYLAGSIVVRYVEQLVHHGRGAGGFAEANRRLMEQVVWPHVVGVQIWLLVLLLVFCTARELARALGLRRLTDLFFIEAHRRSHGEPPEQRPA